MFVAECSTYSRLRTVSKRGWSKFKSRKEKGAGIRRPWPARGGRGKGEGENIDLEGNFIEFSNKLNQIIPHFVFGYSYYPANKGEVLEILWKWVNLDMRNLSSLFSARRRFIAKSMYFHNWNPVTAAPLVKLKAK